MPMPRAQSTSTAPIDPARAKLVDAVRTAWIGRLIDLSRRNNLLFSRPIPTSSIDLTTQNPGLLELLAGRSVTGEALRRIQMRGQVASLRSHVRPRRIAGKGLCRRVRELAIE